MGLEELKQNIWQERELIKEIDVALNSGNLQQANSLVAMMKIVNDSIPSLVESVSPVKNLKPEPPKEVNGLVAVRYEDSGKYVTINSRDRKKFYKELNLSKLGLKKIGRDSPSENQKFKKPSVYAKISNKIFSGMSNRMVENGRFHGLNTDLRKANIPFILNTYVSIILFSSLVAAGVAIVAFIFLMFFSLSLEYPFISGAKFSFLRLAQVFGICLAIPIVTFFATYLYPAAEKRNIRGKVDQELPFATMHMGAIAGSGIEPSQIFKIVALGREYPATKQEIKKVINLINVYGYDLVSALKICARTTSSNKLSELFNGMATTISSGGSLTDFLDKRTETLLFDYKLEREKATKTAETFMDIYISVVIAAPMIMMLLLVLMSVSNISIGLGLIELTIIIVAIVALINVMFLVFLHLKQPGY